MHPLALLPLAAAGTSTVALIAIFALGTICTVAFAWIVRSPLLEWRELEDLRERLPVLEDSIRALTEQVALEVQRAEDAERRYEAARGEAAQLSWELERCRQGRRDGGGEQPGLPRTES